MARTKDPTFEEYKFRIDAFSRERMPMRYLAEYLTDLATLFGEEAYVHFDRIEDGSTVPVMRVEKEADPRVNERLHRVKIKDGPQDAQKAYESLNERLRKDNADGVLSGPGGNVLIFPGIKENLPPEYGPFTQFDVIEGVPIMIGGEREQVPIHLEGDDREIMICYAKRSLAKDIAPFLFTTTIRVEGNARWVRDREGQWHIKYFSVLNFKPVNEGSIADDIKRLRSIPGKWKEFDDPLHELDIIRREGEIQ